MTSVRIIMTCMLECSSCLRSHKGSYLSLEWHHGMNDEGMCCYESVVRVCMCQYGCLVCKTVDLCVQIETNKFPSNLLCWSLWGLSSSNFQFIYLKCKKYFGWWLKFRYLRKSFVWLFGAILWYFFLSSNGVHPSVTSQQYCLSQTKLL